MKCPVLIFMLLICCEVLADDIPSPESWVEINGMRFFVEVATTKESRSRGLMFRTTLAKERGMLFVYPSDRTHKFWMKNTLIPLDIIYLDSQRRVVSMALDAQPCVEESCMSYPSVVPARYVVEINAGSAASLNLKVGDRLHFGGVMQEPE